MCGISLALSANAETAESAVRKMVSSMHHRGPDGSQIYTHQLSNCKTLSLGHNRLSILDLSEHASQPIHSQDNRYVMIFNGEIFNYKELKSELDCDSEEIIRGGDTIVAFHLIIKLRERAFERFNGMWSIVFLDTLENTIIVSRDRLGVKPLYYYQDSNVLLVASEIKAILRALPRKFQINNVTAVSYLTRGIINHTLGTFFSNIFAFPPASLQVINLDEEVQFGRLTKKYWRHPYEIPCNERPASTIDLNEIRATFIDSVDLRLRSDVPVGVLLSGGIDSSSILGAIRYLNKLENVTVLSVISDDPRHSEEEYINLMSSYAGIEPVRLNVSLEPDRYFEQLGNACWYSDQPVLSFSAIAHMHLMQIAKSRGIKVILSGQGADEQLGGYNKFLYFYLYELLKKRNIYEFSKQVALTAIFSNVFYEFRFSEALRYLQPSAIQNVTFIRKQFRCLDGNDLSMRGNYATREWEDITRWSLPALLHNEDRMSMSQSIEIRVPFLDYRLIESFGRLPASEKFSGGKSKSIFRRAMKGLIPDGIRNRRDKKGFNIPENEWLKGRFRAQIENMFGSPMLSAKLGFIDQKELMYCYLAFVKGSRIYNEKSFFRVIAFEMFLRKFSDFIEF